MATSAAPHSGHGPTHRLSLLWAFVLGAKTWKRGLTPGQPHAREHAECLRALSRSCGRSARQAARWLARGRARAPWRRGGAGRVWAPPFCRHPGGSASGSGCGEPGGASPLSPEARSPGGTSTADHAASPHRRSAAGLECRAGAKCRRGRPAAAPLSTPARAA
jgi:hypothetical protein